jgi:hypothetical protein
VVDCVIDAAVRGESLKDPAKPGRGRPKVAAFYSVSLVDHPKHLTEYLKKLTVRVSHAPKEC